MSERGVLETRFMKWTRTGALVLASATAIFLAVLYFSFRSQINRIGAGMEEYSRAEGLSLARLVLYDLAADSRIRNLGILERNLLDRAGSAGKNIKASGVVLDFVRQNMDLPDTRIWLKAGDAGIKTTVEEITGARIQIYRSAVREESASIGEDLEAKVTFSDHLRGVLLRSDSGIVAVKAGESIPSPRKMENWAGQTVHAISPSKMVITLPLYVETHRWGTVSLLLDRRSLVEAEAETAGILTRGLVETGILFLLILAAWGVFWTLALRAFRRDVVRPVVALARRMEGLEQESPLPQPDIDEPRWLSEAFDRLLARLDAQQERLIDAERLGMMEKMGAGLSHELNNALNPAMLRLDELLMERKPAEGEEIKAIRGYLVSARRVLKELTLLGPARDSTPRPLAPAEWLRIAGRLVEPQFKGSGVKIHWSAGLEEPLVSGEERALTQVAVNLLLNALDAAGPPEGGGNVWVRLSDGPKGVMLHIEDDGPGLTEEVSGRLFQPFVTTKAKGTGLGLYMVKVLLDRMGASIAIRGRDPVGTVVEVTIQEALKAGERR